MNVCSHTEHNLHKYQTNSQRASLKQTRGCGSLCWCYHSNTLTAICFCPPADTLQSPSLLWDRKQWFLLNWPPRGASKERPLKDFVDGRRTMIPPHCSDEPAGAAVRRSSNTSADLPTDASGFTARWLSCEGERWFASLLWYFQRQQEQHTTPRQPRRYRHWRHLRQSVVWICKSTSRGMKPRETACPFDLLMCFSQVKQRRSDCISCCWWLPAGWLLADTADWYNVILQQQRHSKSVWNAAVSPRGVREHQQCRASERTVTATAGWRYLRSGSISLPTYS